MLFSCDKDLRGQSPYWKPWTSELVQEEETYRNPQKQAVIVCHGANYCQVNGCFLLSALCAAERDLPATLGRARIQHPFHQTKNFRPFLGFRNK